MDFTFGIVSEGVTDQAVIEQIFYGYFQDPDLLINPLQPSRDATDKTIAHGTWSLVFDYCSSERFKNAFEDNDFVIIQIDTDSCHQAPFGIDTQRTNESVESFIIRVQERFVQLWEEKWGASFCVEYFHRILFAIAVNEIECWLLPLYLQGKQRGKTSGCKSSLEKKLKKGIPKNYKEYVTLARPYRKEKIQTLKDYYTQNPSLQYFMEKEFAYKICFYRNFQ